MSTEAPPAAGAVPDRADAAPRAGLPRLAHGLRVWYAVTGGIWAWTIHLLFVSSFVQFACNKGGVSWVQHVATAATAAMTVVALALSVGLLREGRGADEADSGPAGRMRFLGTVGLLIGGINLALILLEGSYVFFLKPCA